MDSGVFQSIIIPIMAVAGSAGVAALVRTFTVDRRSASLAEIEAVRDDNAELRAQIVDVWDEYFECKRECAECTAQRNAESARRTELESINLRLVRRVEQLEAGRGRRVTDT